MSSRARKAQRLTQLDSSDSIKHARTTDGNEEYSSLRGLGGTSGSDGDSQEFDRGAVEFLNFDPRPTFVVDKRNHNLDSTFESIFSNEAFRTNHQLTKIILPNSRPTSPQHSPKASTLDFSSWMNDFAENGPSELPTSSSFSYCDHIWSAFIFRERWMIFSGSSLNLQATRQISLPLRSDTDSANKPSGHHTDTQHEGRIEPNRNQDLPDIVQKLPASFVTPGTPDWTAAIPEGELSSHVIFARSVDWASTPLGSMTMWTAEFRQVANLLMSNPHPAALFWGEELTVMYNKAYADGVAGHKHPQLMGTGFRGPFSEIWEEVGAIFNEVTRTGKSVAVENQMLPIERRGFGEETFFTWSLTPLYGGTKKLLGLYNAPFETTRQTINDRRTRTLLNLGEEVAVAKTVSDFWRHVLNALEENESDFPFALLYSVAEDCEIDECSSMSSESSMAMKSCVLEGTLGVPEGHPAAPTKLDLKHARGGFIPAFRDAMQTREPKLLNILDGTLSKSLIEGLEWRGFGQPCKLAVVCPVRPTTGENVLGFLVVGINPRRPYDEDYESFIRLLNRQLATSLASVKLFEDEIRRGDTAAESAALERSRLSEELAFQRGRFQRMAEVSPVGMFSIDHEGLLLEANDRWYEMTGHPRDDIYKMSWMETIMESSREVMQQGWERLIEYGMPWSAELQLKKLWYDPTTGEKHDNWILASSQPEFTPRGNVKAVMGSITDITSQKRSAKDADARAKLSEQLLLLQKQRLEEAEETRRQQNNFIDITSHEMRNPLSAIVQCADSISTSMAELQNSPNTALDPAIIATVKSCIEAAETIQLCAQHQKSIVDDILTISKLDSNLLLITPVPIQPIKVIQQALKMFAPECAMTHITMNLHIETSVKELNVDWVMLDSSRLLQILINLLTNAIKFTKSEKSRYIDMFIAAHLEPPADGIANFRYFPTNKARADVTAGDDWGSGEILYLRFEVRDTGCGLNESEKMNLFTRFSQASPRTHVQYGGSGLGLFISRQLTELQGGEIGVASEAGKGSTFAFYLKSRRSEAQPSAIMQLKLNSDLESSARLAINVAKSLRDDEGSISKLHQLRDSSGPPSEPLSILPEASPSDWHVLIVEDNLVNQKILAAQITKLGCTTYVANHGGEALDLIRETKHYKGNEKEGKNLSVILMDLEMPVMDGLTCVRKIREMEQEGQIQGHIPIIAVTANARGEQIAAAKDSGMDDVMPKPFRIRQLVPKIEGLLGREAREM